MPSFFLTKKKFAAYGLQDSRIVPLCRCSATNLCASAISSCVRGRSRPGSVDGALGSSSMAWSHIVWLGRRWDSSSLNTFLCRKYSLGSAGAGVLFLRGWNVTFCHRQYFGKQQRLSRVC